VIEMARAKTVELTDVNGAKWFVPEDEFNSGGVPESPDSVIGNYMHGSRGPMIKVNTLSTMLGEWHFLNPDAIVSMKVTYPNG
jgi:hypothetical protein